MRKRFFLLSLILFVFASSANAQLEEYITFGINGGINKNINGYKKDKDYYGNTFSDGLIAYNYGLDFGIKTGKRFRTRMEVRSIEFHYVAKWDTVGVPPQRNPYETRVKVWNMDIVLRGDYLLAQTEKNKLFISPSFIWEFNIDRECKNMLRNVGNDEFNPYRDDYRDDFSFKKYNDIHRENPNHIIGSSVALIYKYKFAKHIGITVTPEYTIFYRGMVRTNYGKPYQRLTLNAGLEFSF